MSNPTVISTPSSYFRRRTIGRAASPPTWACYEQIPYDDEDEDEDDEDYSDTQSEDESCSEDQDDYRPSRDPTLLDHTPNSVTPPTTDAQDDTHIQNMEIDEADRRTHSPSPSSNDEKGAAQSQFKKDIKGKQRAVDPEPEAAKRRHRKRDRRPTHTLRPILTIQKSQGFVWNQVRPLPFLSRMPLRDIGANRARCPSNRTCLSLLISRIDVSPFP